MAKRCPRYGRSIRRSFGTGTGECAYCASQLVAGEQIEIREIISGDTDTEDYYLCHSCMERRIMPAEILSCCVNGDNLTADCVHQWQAISDGISRCIHCGVHRQEIIIDGGNRRNNIEVAQGAGGSLEATGKGEVPSGQTGCELPRPDTGSDLRRFPGAQGSGESTTVDDRQRTGLEELKTDGDPCTPVGVARDPRGPGDKDETMPII